MNQIELTPRFGILRDTMFLKIVGDGEITYFEIYDKYSGRGIGTTIHSTIIASLTRKERIHQLTILLGYLCVNAHKGLN